MMRNSVIPDRMSLTISFVLILSFACFPAGPRKKQCHASVISVKTFLRPLLLALYFSISSLLVIPDLMSRSRSPALIRLMAPSWVNFLKSLSNPWVRDCILPSAHNRSDLSEYHQALLSHL